MQTPGLREEQKLWQRGLQYIAGIDEVGRGPLAGPVVAAAVIIKNAPRNTLCFLPPHQNATGVSSWMKSKEHCPKATDINPRCGGLQPDGKELIIKDSKKLSPKRREKIFQLLIKSPSIDYGIGVVSEKIIDQINILEASLMAMKQALSDLKISPEFLLIDGQHTLEDISLSQKAIIHGDSKVYSIAIASIIAKVTRDRLMKQIHNKYPVYRFDIHKGYGTKLHLDAIRKYGPCEIHRKSFRPIKNCSYAY